jgi:hypothetical protein
MSDSSGEGKQLPIDSPARCICKIRKNIKSKPIIYFLNKVN